LSLSCSDAAPTGLGSSTSETSFGDPEDVLGGVFVAVLQNVAPLVFVPGEVLVVGGVAGLGLDSRPLAFERVGDALQEDEAEDEMLYSADSTEPRSWSAAEKRSRANGRSPPFQFGAASEGVVTSSAFGSVG
jgi:hypothetical protein